jgi:tetratricopeptide (TPR) repeat protein
LDNAVECHEEVVELLDKINTNNDSQAHGEFEPSSLQHDIVYHKIHFINLPRCLRWQLMVTSLQALGKLYVEKGELEEAIIAYQDTLSTLRRLHDFQVESTLQRQEEILQILGALSDFYMQNYLESTDVVKLERAAILQEDLEHWEKAMQCWERVLY